MGPDIARYVGGTIIALVIGAALVGMAFMAMLLIAVPWVWNHVHITFGAG